MVQKRKYQYSINLKVNMTMLKSDLCRIRDEDLTIDIDREVDDIENNTSQHDY